MLNVGNYYGNGYSSVGGGSFTGRANMPLTSMRMSQMSRNTASSFSQDFEIINKYLEDGKTDKAIEKYTSLFGEAREANAYSNTTLTDSQIQSILKQAYEAQTGTSLIESIEKNTSNSFWTGFKQSIPIIGFFVNDTSEAEALAKLSGDKVSTKDKVLEFAGMAAGTALFAAATFGLGPIFNALKGVSWIKKAGETAKIVHEVGGAMKLTKAAKTVGTVATIGSAVTSAGETLNEF